MKNNQGQSLVELVTAVAIFTLICFSALSFLGFATNTYYNVIRHEKLMYEYRLVSFWVDDFVKNSNSYEIVNDDIVFDGVTLNITSAKSISTYVTSFNSSIIDDFITVSFYIKISDMTEGYQMKLLLPPQN